MRVEFHPGLTQYGADRVGGQRLVHVPATRLVQHVFGDFAGQRRLRTQEPEAAGHQQREHHGCGQRERRGRAGGARARNRDSGTSSALRTPAVERQRLVAEAAAVRAAWRDAR